MGDGEHEGGDYGDREEDKADGAALRVAPLLAATVATHARARRRKDDGRTGSLLLLLLVIGVREEERRNVVVDIKVGEGDFPHPRPAYRPRSRKQRMAAGGMRPSNGSPLAARLRRSVLEIASGGMRTCSTRHPGPGAPGSSMSALLTMTTMARSRMTSGLSHVARSDAASAPTIRKRSASGSRLCSCSTVSAV